MIGVIYISTEMTSFSETEFMELSKASEISNKKNGITGFLMYQDGRFVQYLEGTEHAVKQVVRRIEEDLRHVVDFSYAERLKQGKRFPNWWMRLLSREDLKKVSLEGFLMEYMTFLDRVSGGDIQVTDAVWRFVDEVKRLQTRMPSR